MKSAFESCIYSKMVTVEFTLLILVSTIVDFRIMSKFCFGKVSLGTFSTFMLILNKFLESNASTTFAAIVCYHF